MKIEIQRKSGAFHLEARNEHGNTVQTDASPAIGGTDKGMRPMELLLSALGACSSIDVIELLRKQRQQLDDIQINVSGERAKDQVPAVFTDIHIHFTLTGPVLDDDKVRRALELSVKKLCSVGKMLEKTAVITYDYTIKNNA